MEAERCGRHDSTRTDPPAWPALRVTNSRTHKHPLMSARQNRDMARSWIECYTSAHFSLLFWPRGSLAVRAVRSYGAKPRSDPAPRATEFSHSSRPDVLIRLDFRTCYARRFIPPCRTVTEQTASTAARNSTPSPTRFVTGWEFPACTGRAHRPARILTAVLRRLVPAHRCWPSRPGAAGVPRVPASTPQVSGLAAAYRIWTELLVGLVVLAEVAPFPHWPFLRRST
jgi:hypothetical protein